MSLERWGTHTALVIKPTIVQRTKEGKMSKSLNETLEALGLTNEQAKTLIDLTGITEEDDFQYIEEPDLVNDSENKEHPGLGLKRVKARKFLMKLRGSTQEQGVFGPSEITVKVDHGPKPVEQMRRPLELLEVLEDDKRSEDEKIYAAGFLDAIQHGLVFKKHSNEHDPQQTRAFWKAGDFSLKFWSRDNLQVRPAGSLFQDPNDMVELDPYEYGYGLYAMLTDGYNSKSGADWSNVSMKRRALVSLYMGDHPVGSIDSVKLAQDFSGTKELPGIWAVREARVDEEKLQEELDDLKVIRVRAREMQKQYNVSSAFMSASRKKPEVKITGPMRTALINLLLSLFEQSEFRSFWGYSLDQNKGSLPGKTASDIDLATAIASQAASLGLLTRRFFWDKLREERDFRISDIDRVAARYGH